MAFRLRGCFEQFAHECNLALNTWLFVMDVPRLIHAKPADYALDSLAKATGRTADDLKTTVCGVGRLVAAA